MENALHLSPISGTSQPDFANKPPDTPFPVVVLLCLYNVTPSDRLFSLCRLPLTARRAMLPGCFRLPIANCYKSLIYMELSGIDVRSDFVSPQGHYPATPYISLSYSIWGLLAIRLELDKNTQ